MFSTAIRFFSLPREECNAALPIDKRMHLREI